MDKEIFAQNLNFELDRRELSKGDLAMLSGLSRSFIFFITRDVDPHNCSFDKASAISNALSLPLFLFFLPPAVFQTVVVQLPISPKQPITPEAALKALINAI